MVKIDFLLFILIAVGLVLLGWYSQRRHERFEDGTSNADADAAAFKTRVSLLESSRDEDSTNPIAGSTTPATDANGEVYSFVANYCT